MAIAHHCLACGTDLARVRADRRNQYRLPLVHCPRCGNAAVRKRDDLVALLRRIRRVALAVGQIVVRLAVLFLCTVLSVMALYASVASIMDWDREPATGGAPHWLIGLSSLGFVLIGAVVATTFGHQPRYRTWLGFVLWWLFVIFVAPVAVIVADSGPKSIADELRRHFLMDETILAMKLFVPACLLMILGLPLGTRLHRAGAFAGQAMRRRQWRRLRAATRCV